MFFTAHNLWICHLIILLMDSCSGRCLQVIPERAAVVYVNDKYATDVKLYVKRFSRRSTYVMNLEGTIKQTFGNNVSVHFVFYEYLHNEYKRSFVEMHFKACDLVNSDPYIGQAVANAGIKCPIPPGPVRINNVTIPAQNFPNVWPFERCKVDIKIKLVSPEELIGNLEVYVLFKQNIG